MSIDDIKKAVHGWFENEINATVIFADQASPRPSEFPHGTIRIDSISAMGSQDETLLVDDQGDQKLKGLREISVTLEIYGEGCDALMLKAQASLSKMTVLEKFWHEHSISNIDVGPIINIAEILETETEPRVQMDVTMAFVYDHTDAVGLIEKVEITDKNTGDTQTIDLT